MQFEKPDALIFSTQRSGTHLLLSLLGSHPQVHGRSECFLRYRNCLFNPGEIPRNIHNFLFINRPGKMNIAILMYSQIGIYERLCGSLFSIKVIHLLRDAGHVTRSCEQYRANKELHGPSFRAHYRQGEEMPPDAPLDGSKLAEIAAEKRKAQDYYVTYLAMHSACLTVHYEELTKNEQVNSILDEQERKLLVFLGLDYHPLNTTLKKSLAARLSGPQTSK